MAVNFDVAVGPVDFGTNTSSTTTGVTVGAGDTDLAIFATFGVNPGPVTAVWDFGGTNQSIIAVETSNDSGGAQAWAGVVHSPTPGSKTLKLSWPNSSQYIIASATFTGGGSHKNGAVVAGSTDANGAGVLSIGAAANEMAIGGFAGGVWTASGTGATGTNVYFNTSFGGIGVRYIAGPAVALGQPGSSAGAPYSAAGFTLSAPAASPPPNEFLDGGVGGGMT